MWLARVARYVVLCVAGKPYSNPAIFCRIVARRTSGVLWRRGTTVAASVLSYCDVTAVGVCRLSISICYGVARCNMYATRAPTLHDSVCVYVCGGYFSVWLALWQRLAARNKRGCGLVSEQCLILISH